MVNDTRVNRTERIRIPDGGLVRRKRNVQNSFSRFPIQTYDGAYYQCGVFDSNTMLKPFLSTKKFFQIPGNSFNFHFDSVLFIKTKSKGDHLSKHFLEIFFLNFANMY